MENDNWLVYILRCVDGTFYTGATNDMVKRLKAHNSGKNGARYTRTRRPCEVIAKSGLMSKSEALKLEYQVKKQKRENKVKFLNEFK